MARRLCPGFVLRSTRSQRTPCQRLSKYGCASGNPSGFSRFPVVDRPLVGSAMGGRIESPLQQLRPPPLLLKKNSAPGLGAVRSLDNFLPPTRTIAPPGARYNLSPHPRSKRAAFPLEKSSTFTRSARRICDPKAIRLLHPCYNLRGALANPQEESPRTRNHPRYPLPGATFNPPGKSPRTWHLVPPRKAGVTLHGKRNSNSHGARPVY